MDIPLKNEGIVFNIQRYSVHDGPGIRTIVFLQGCPLSCLWCSNPEGAENHPVLSHNAVLCVKCSRCASACPRGAVSFAEGGPVVTRELCQACGGCAAVCPSGAMKIFGSRMTVGEVLDDVVRDEAFYRRSGGGLTLSGGEPLFCSGFCLALLKKAKEDYGLDTAVETSLYAPPEIVEKMLFYTDHVLADIKLMDSSRHREYTGRDNSLILDNLRLAAARGADLLVRFPLIPGINDDEENLNAMAEFLESCASPPLEILPYHEFGRGKFFNLGRAYPLADKKITLPDREKINRAEEFLRARAVRVVHT